MPMPRLVRRVRIPAADASLTLNLALRAGASPRGLARAIRAERPSGGAVPAAAAPTSGRANADAWCRALVTDRDALRPRGAQAPAAEGSVLRVKQKGFPMLIAYQVSLDLIRSVRPIVEVLAARDKDLADQLQRAATSVCLNVAEGSRRIKGDQRRFYTYANGSAMEVRAAIEAAEAWGWIANPEATCKLLDRLLGLLWGLTRTGPHHATRPVRQSPQPREDSIEESTSDGDLATPAPRLGGIERS